MMRRTGLGATCALALVLATSAATAGGADVVDVAIIAEPGGLYNIDVTVAHADEGWEHYADLWQVLAPDGTVLCERELLHPHETEQPFTRSLSGVAIPPEVTAVTVRARDSVHGFSGVEMTVPVPR